MSYRRKLLVLSEKGNLIWFDFHYIIILRGIVSWEGYEISLEIVFFCWGNHSLRHFILPPLESLNKIKYSASPHNIRGMKQFHPNPLVPWTFIRYNSSPHYCLILGGMIMALFIDLELEIVLNLWNCHKKC